MGGMYKNQLQEFAQQSCINLPSYSCIREGPDHAPLFKAKVNCNGEIFESPKFCCTLRQAEHAAAEVALKTLSRRGPSRAVATKVLDETGIYKNLLQETAHRAGMKLPVYTTVRTGPGYAPVFTCTVELEWMIFPGEPARTKKQAQKSAAMAAWFALKERSHACSSSHHLSDLGRKDEQEQVIVARYLSSLKLPKMSKSREKDNPHKELFPVKGDLIPYGVGRPSYRKQNPNSTFSCFPPQRPTYETWHQGVPQQQSHFIALPSTSTSIPRPRFFPFIQSMFRPDIASSFWARDQQPIPILPEPGSLFYLSSNLLPVPDRHGSRVTIEEIEDNSPIQVDWLNKDVNLTCWRDNILSLVPGISMLDALGHPQSCDSYSGLGAKLLERETGEHNVQSTNLSSKSAQPINQHKEFSWLPPGFFCNRQNVMEAGEAWLQPSGSMWSDVQHLHHKAASSSSDRSDLLGLTTVSGVTGRNAGAVSSNSFPSEVSNRSLPVSTPRRNAVFTSYTRPRLEATRYLRPVPCATQMAPAVQIRTIMPVCSSSNSRMPSPSQESEDISAACSEFCRLQI